MPNFSTVWHRIANLDGQVFTQINGGEFSYECNGNTLILSRTNQIIARSQLESAYELVPLSSTVAVQHLRAPSYLYAILMDERIREGDW